MSTPPGGIRAATFFSILSALALLASAGVQVVLDVIDDSFVVSTLGTTGFYVVVALIIIPVSLKLRTGSPMARGFVITWSLILVLAMLTLIRILGWQAYVGIALGIMTLAALALPTSRSFIRKRDLFSGD